MSGLPIKDNYLHTRDEVVLALGQLLDPVGSYFGNHSTQLNFGHTGSATCGRTAAMEGLLRPLWGLGPATCGGYQSDLWRKYREAITYGTNPDCEDYWGDIGDYDQKIVEIAPIGLSMALAPEEIWTPLDESVKNRFSSWMNQVNEKELPPTNWRFFLVLANIGLKKVGANYNQERMEKELDELDKYYLSDGWYSDGIGDNRDYYISMAMHYYGLVYSKLMREEDPVRSQTYVDRAKLFAEDFIYWFSAEGDALPFGRSLTYRFAQASFWSALVFADVEVYSLGVVKGIILRHLRHWFKQDIFTEEGILSIGYNYENLIMAENYNAPGSPYWAMKTFLILAMPVEHPFWQAKEEPLPKLETTRLQKHAYMVIERENENHFAAFTSGQHVPFEPDHMENKYEKFVYSNIFGFSVPKGQYGLEQGVFDNMLALSEQDNYYRGRHRSTVLHMDDNMIESEWFPWKDVKIHTWLIPGLPWHIRIHNIQNNRPLDAAEGGYGLTRENKHGLMSFEKVMTDNHGNHGIMLENKEAGNKASGIVDLLYEGEAVHLFVASNTNLVTPRTVLPTIKYSLEVGEHWLISAVYGSNTGADMRMMPELADDGDSYMVRMGKRTIHVDKIKRKVITKTSEMKGIER